MATLRKGAASSESREHTYSQYSDTNNFKAAPSGRETTGNRTSRQRNWPSGKRASLKCNATHGCGSSFPATHIASTETASSAPTVWFSSFGCVRRPFKCCTQRTWEYAPGGGVRTASILDVNDDGCARTGVPLRFRSSRLAAQRAKHVSTCFFDSAASIRNAFARRRQRSWSADADGEATNAPLAGRFSFCGDVDGEGASATLFFNLCTRLAFFSAKVSWWRSRSICLSRCRSSFFKAAVVK